MKKLKAIIGVLASSLMLGAAVGVSSIQKNQEMQKVSAAGISSGSTFYVDLRRFNDWAKDGRYIGVYFYGDGDGWSDFTQTHDTYIYSFTVPGNGKAFTGAIALRKNNNNKDWSGEENRSGDKSISSTNNCIQITDWNSSAVVKSMTAKTYFLDMKDKSDWCTANNGALVNLKLSNTMYTIYTNKISVSNIQNSNYIVSFYVLTSDAFTKIAGYRWDSTGSSAWNNTADLTLSSNNCVKITDWNTGTATTVSYGVSSGQAVYVNFNNVSYWLADNTHPYMYFFNEINGDAGVWSAEMTEVQGTTDKMLECVVPGTGKTYTGMIAVRGKSATPSWSDIYNQSSDLYVSARTQANVRNELVVYINDNRDQQNRDTSQYSTSLSDSARGVIYGKYFLDTVSCSGSGNTDATTTAQWTDVTTEYNHMSSGCKTVVTNATTTGSDDLSKAMLRYDYIVFYKHYNHADFASRSGSTGRAYSIFSPLPLTLIAGDTNNSALIIIIVSLVSVTAIGGYFFLRKRKQER